MTLTGFIIGVLALLFGYNLIATEWQKRQERKRQQRLEERRNRYR